MYADETDSDIAKVSRKSSLGAYLAAILMSVVLTAVIMAGVEGEAAIPAEPSLYTGWTMLAGAIGGGLAFFAAKGWFGQTGLMGATRAVVGSIAVALMGAVIVGLLILPAMGAFYAPVMLVTEFLARPILAAVWFAVLLGAHYLMTPDQKAMAWEAENASTRTVSSQLSSLTRANLYRK
jgi:hypothetical protein